MGEWPQLSKKEIEQADKENEKWKKKGVYWHNAIPNFDGNMRGSLTNDVQTITNIEQLELNKKLYAGINWNNWINIAVSFVNLILLIINLILLFKK